MLVLLARPINGQAAIDLEGLLETSLEQRVSMVTHSVCVCVCVHLPQ